MNDTPVPNPSPTNAYGPVAPSQMLERTAALLRENFKLFFGIALVVIGVEIAIAAVLGGSGFWMEHSIVGASPVMRALVILPVSLLGAVLIYVVTQIVQGALFIATDARLAGAPMSVGEACSRATEHAGRLIGIAVLVALRTLGYIVLLWLAVGIPIVLLIIGSRAAGMLHMQAGNGSLAAIGIGIVLFLASIVLYIVLLFWIFARYSLAIPATLAENLSVTASIRRSIRLSKGSRGRIYALLLFIFCIYLGIVAVIAPIQMMTMRGTLLHPAAPTLAFGGVTALLALFRIIVSGFAIAIFGIATALCYYDLRVRKEGFGGSQAVPTAHTPIPVWPAAPDLPIEDFPIS